MLNADEVLRSLPLPPKNLTGKESQIVQALVATWVEDCAGKCANAELTQDQVNNVFLGWLRRTRGSRYDEIVINYMVKKLIRMPRPKRTAEANEESRARQVINAAAKLRGQLAVITGTKIVEVGEDAGNTPMSLVETWKSRGQRPRSVINDIMDEIQRKLLLVDNRTRPVDEDDASVTEAAE